MGELPFKLGGAVILEMGLYFTGRGSSHVLPILKSLVPHWKAGCLSCFQLLWLFARRKGWIPVLEDPGPASVQSSTESDSTLVSLSPAHVRLSLLTARGAVRLCSRLEPKRVRMEWNFPPSPAVSKTRELASICSLMPPEAVAALVTPPWRWGCQPLLSPSRAHQQPADTDPSWLELVSFCCCH